jgi:hypothetical protein
MLEQVIVIGFAAASIWKLAISDRITQWWRYRYFKVLSKAGGWIPYHLQYLVACAMCFPLWASLGLYLSRNTEIGHGIAIVFAARIVGYALLRWLSEATVRDLPDGVKFPPER